MSPIYIYVCWYCLWLIKYRISWISNKKHGVTNSYLIQVFQAVLRHPPRLLMPSYSIPAPALTVLHSIINFAIAISNMASKYTVDWNDLESLKKEITSTKKWTTRACTKIEKLVLRPVVHSTLDEARDARQELTAAFNHLAELFDGADTLEVNDTAIKTNATELARYKVKYETGLSQLASHLQSQQNGAIQPTPTTSSTPTPSVGCKTDKFLAPDILTKDFTLEDFRRWTKAFERFYNSSNLSSKPLYTQHAYFLKCIDKDLQHSIEPLLLPDTPIVTDRVLMIGDHLIGNRDFWQFLVIVIWLESPL